jgi:hypothetical protein
VIVLLQFRINKINVTNVTSTPPQEGLLSSRNTDTPPREFVSVS